MLKKTIIITTAAATILSASANKDKSESIENLQQKTSLILIKKMHILNSKVDNLKLSQIKMQIELKNLKKRLENADINMTNESNFLKKISNTPMKKTLKSDSDGYELKNIYRIKNDIFNKNSHGRKKMYKKNSFVVIINKNKTKSQTNDGSWIDNEKLAKINKSILKKGKFYKINTYMANSRNDAGVNNEIESVFYKNDIILITSSKKAKDGGVWKKILNDGYINQRIVKPIKIKE